jgi:dephospho-CoA kinase
VKALGITGGIGMGKSTASEILRRWGVPVTDSDIIARQIVEPGQPALADIASAFGAEMVGADGRLRRGELAGRIFADPASRQRLEAIMHPRIRAVWQAQLDAWKQAGEPQAAAVIPLLFETDAASHFDATICLACTAATQRQRLQQRGWTDSQIDARLQAQISIERKMQLADFVVWTEGDLSVTEEQLRRIIR